MKRSGPDSLHSWIIAGACCFINMMMFGMVRLAGVMFVASVPRFQVEREAASFPYTFASFTRNTSGPLVGYLGHKLGVRLVTTFGCILGSLGLGFCYFAENISTVTVLWGFVFGLGFGLGNILLPVSINQYFDKNRATGSGISFAGNSLGSFILPPVVEILINSYGLSGTYLFLAAFILSCVPAALLLKKPNFVIETVKPDLEGSEGEKQSIMSGKKVKLYTVENDSQTSAVHRSSTFEANLNFKINKDDLRHMDQNDAGNDANLTYEERVKRLSTQTLLSDYSIRMSSSEPLDFEHIIHNSKGRRKVDPAILECEVSSVNSQITDQDSEKDDVFGKEYATAGFPENPEDNQISIAGHSGQFYRALSTDSILPLSKDNIEYHDAGCYNMYYQRDIDEDFKTCAASGRCPHKSSISISPSVGSDSPKTKKKATLQLFSVILDPIFILIAITNAFYSFIFVCMMTVIVDFARDIGIEATNEKYLLMSLSVGDLIGRLGLGWVTDGGYMTRANFAALCFLCQGISTTVIAWSTGFPMLISLIALYGLSEASLIVIYPLIIAEFIEQENQTIAIPTSYFLSGPLCLAVAPMIGFFRDEVGSYVYIFYGIGAVSALCCIAWLLAPCIAKCRKTSCK